MSDPHATPRARLMTRWIGTGIGGALLITVLSLTFARDCVTSAQSHVLAVVLALGAAILLWGIVGGLQIDVKLKFKALGEVTAAGVAAIFLVVHFVSSDGIIAAEDGCDDEGTFVLRGRVHEKGKMTRGIAGATVKIELPDGIVDRTTDDEGQFDRSIDGDVSHVKVWVVKDGYKDSEVKDIELPLTETKVVIELTRSGSKPSGTKSPRPSPTAPRLPTDPKVPVDPRPVAPTSPTSADTQPKLGSGLRINSDATKAKVQPEEPRAVESDDQSALRLLR